MRASSRADDNEREAGGKRELIEPHESDKRYVRRNAEGKFDVTVHVLGTGDGYEPTEPPIHAAAH